MIRLCGPSLPQWTLSLKSLPALKERDTELRANQSRIPEAVHTKGYGNFAESYVHDVEVRTAIGVCCVRAKCFKSMKKNAPPHSLNLKLSIIDSCVKISECLCLCKAGERDCNHILGLLYLLHHYCKCGYKTVPILQSKAFLKQTWHIPAKTNGITPKKVQGINFQKISLSKSVEGSPQAKRFRLDGVKSFYNPVETP
ncbi:hypothetical protein SNE40_021251 [Patella caerulea]|uniref:SWIM-type domain-containing protein n=1 Tax=Patella caerulea TaxID=87958 RepID=A0AAN8GCD8_PATCE